MSAPPTAHPHRSPGARVRPSVCIIGAGISGLVTLRALRAERLEPRVFEASDHVGGLWRFGNGNGRSAAYRSLHINTSKGKMGLSDFPWPPETPDYPRHDQVARYFDDYAQHFRLLDHVRFRTEVVSVAPLPAGGHEVVTREVESGRTHAERFDAVVVASGHHWAPAFPRPFPEGRFEGGIYHSHGYVDPDSPPLRGKRVVVVGIGNSAADIACDLGRPGVAERVFLSMRRGAWVIPKYLRGKPVDEGTTIPTWLPKKLRRRLVTQGFRMLVGDMTDFGLPQPDHLIGEAHPTLSSELPLLVAAGEVLARPEIRAFEGRSVIFVDGSREEADAVIFCTGYDVRFPFFSEDYVSAPDNELPLYLRVAHPEHPSVFFVGLAQPLGAIVPIVEAQARLLAEHLTGRHAFPDEARLLESIEAERRANAERYVSSRRHTMQVDPDDYERAVEREILLGHKRALRGEGRPFPAPRAVEASAEQAAAPHTEESP